MMLSKVLLIIMFRKVQMDIQGNTSGIKELSYTEMIERNQELTIDI